MVKYIWHLQGIEAEKKRKISADIQGEHNI